MTIQRFLQHSVSLFLVVGSFLSAEILTPPSLSKATINAFELKLDGIPKEEKDRKIRKAQRVFKKKLQKRCNFKKDVTSLLHTWVKGTLGMSGIKFSTMTTC